LELELDALDQRLIDAASDLIRRLYKPDIHHIGSALLAKSGRIFTAVHFNARLGQNSLCAEKAAISRALSEGESEFDRIVAVKYFPEHDAVQVASPCGMCRELISDYGSDIQVILLDQGQVTKRYIRDLLPWQFSREFQYPQHQAGDSGTRPGVRP
jgi:cytidine deaminase